MAPDIQILEIKRQAAAASAAASLELPEALQEKERQARAMLAEVEAAKAKLAADKRAARSTRIKAVTDALVNLRSTHEPRIEAAVRDGDAAALATAVYDAAIAVRAVSPDLEDVRAIMTDREANSFVQVGSHESVGPNGTVRILVAVLKGALDLNEDSAVQLARSLSVSVVERCIRRISDDPARENAELLFTLLGEVKRFASTGNSRWYGWRDWKNGRSDNQARFWRGLDMLFEQGGFEGKLDLQIKTLIRHPSLGLDG